ncbi:histidinol dehydrogenase, partial [Priestia megaterium]|uniref:histidinol dehydrogenase n=1 Tax=Priestia megaterium TaxID=1404 RepID=UPI0035B5A2DB
MRRLHFSDVEFEARFAALVSERRDTPEDVEASVRDVLAAVRAEGLAAVLRFGAQFDGVALDEASLRVTPEEIEAGAAACA